MNFLIAFESDFMEKGYIAKVSIEINSPITNVWKALIDPELIKQYMFGTEVISEWKAGSKIIWKGIWNNKPYEDKGVILTFKPTKMIEYTHFSPLEGKEDNSENYHTIQISLVENHSNTIVSLSQDNNDSEKAQLYSEKNWKSMLEGLKKVVEK